MRYHLTDSMISLKIALGLNDSTRLPLIGNICLPAYYIRIARGIKVDVTKEYSGCGR